MLVKTRRRIKLHGLDSVRLALGVYDRHDAVDASASAVTVISQLVTFDTTMRDELAFQVTEKSVSTTDWKLQ